MAMLKLRPSRLMQPIPCLLVVLLLLGALVPLTALAWSGASGHEDLALAYIDPGSGSFVIQALVAMVAGIAVTGRMYWTKIKSMLGMASSEDEDEDSVHNDD